MMRRPGSASSRLRNADQPPEWRGTRGPVQPATVAAEPLSRFFSNQRPSNSNSPRGQTANRLTFWKLGVPSIDSAGDLTFKGLSSALRQIHSSPEYRVV